jgi:hypothetical protein
VVAHISTRSCPRRRFNQTGGAGLRMDFVIPCVDPWLVCRMPRRSSKRGPSRLVGYADALDVASLDLPVCRSRLMDVLAEADHPRARHLESFVDDSLAGFGGGAKPWVDAAAEAGGGFATGYANQHGVPTGNLGPIARADVDHQFFDYNDPVPYWLGVGTPAIVGGGRGVVALVKARPGAGASEKALARLFANGRTPTALEISKLAESLRWRPSQTAAGPLKYVDENGIQRIVRTPGSEAPHIELRDQSGQRVDPLGQPVTRRSLGNHTPIEWDLD